MPQPPRNRKELEDFWCAKMQEALSRCQAATAESGKAVQERKILLTSGSDENPAVRLALDVEMNALAEYRRVLDIFTDLVVRGKIPEDSPESG